MKSLRYSRSLIALLPALALAVGVSGTEAFGSAAPCVSCAQVSLDPSFPDPGGQHPTASKQSSGHSKTTLANFGAGKQGGPGRPGGQGRGPTEEEKEKFRLRLGITRDQQTQIEALHKSMDDTRSSYIDLSRQLYTLYKTFDFDRSQAASLRSRINKLHKSMADIQAANEEKLRRILTRDQFDRMQAIIKEDRDKRRREFDERRKRDGGPSRPNPG